MSSVPAVAEQYRFSCRLTGLRESTEYFYKACVTNGRNVLYSEWCSFMTPDPVFDRDTIELTHVHLDFAYPWQGVWPEDGDSWFYAMGEWNGHINCSVDENESFNSRSCHVNFKKARGFCVLKLSSTPIWKILTLSVLS